MKKPVVFCAIAVAMVAYGYFGIFRADQKEQERQEREAKATQIQADDLTRLVFEKHGERRVYAKEDGEWRIVEPIQDLADQSTFNNALDSILSAQRVELVGEKGDFDSKAFGLEEPEAKLILEPKSGGAEELWIGSRKTYDGAHYVLKKADNSLVVMPFTWLTQLDKSVFDLREKKVWRDQDQTLNGIRFVSGANQWELIQEEGGWHIEGGPAWPLSKERVEEYIRHLKDMRLVGVVSEAKDSSDLRKWSLDRPEIKITLQTSATAATSSATPEEFLFSRDAKKNEVYVTSTQLPFIGRLFDQSATDLNKSADSFYDLKQPFAFDMGDVQSVTLKATDTFQLERDGGRWVLGSTAPDGMELDSVQLQVVLDKLEALEAHRFSHPGKWVGRLDKGSFTLVGSNQKTVLEFSWGSETAYPGAAKGEKLMMVPAKVAGDDRTFWLPTADVKIFEQSLLKKVSTEAPSTAKEAEPKSPPVKSQGGQG